MRTTALTWSHNVYFLIYFIGMMKTELFLRRLRKLIFNETLLLVPRITFYLYSLLVRIHFLMHHRSLHHFRRIHRHRPHPHNSSSLTPAKFRR